MSHPGVRVWAMRQIPVPVPSDGHRAARRASPFADARRADRELRRIVLRVREWGLAQGDGVATDALTAVAAAVLDDARGGHSSPLAWPRGRVEQILAVAAPQACARLDASLPPGLAPALSLLLDYLDAMGVLARGSAPLEELKTELEGGEAGRGANARRRAGLRHPAGTGRR